MLNTLAIRRRATTLLGALLLVVGATAPVFLRPEMVAAGQITSRKITISSSNVSATDVTYTVSFNAATTQPTVKGIVVQFCSNSPLINVSCTAPAGLDINTGSLSVNTVQFNGSGVGNAYAINGASSANTLILTNATGNAITSGQTITFRLGSGANNGVTNPSGLGTFYARILTYADDTVAAAYTDTAPGTHDDDGGVALSTANQLTTTARVQEQLQFCVGGTTVDDATTVVSADCSAAFAGAGTCGNSVDLGVVDSASVYVSPLAAATNSGNGCNGAAMVRTNAANGVNVSYYAEADSTGTNHTRALRVTGSTCNVDAYPSTTNTDKCFNSKGAAQGTIAAGTEAFGLTVAAVNPGSTTTYSCTFAGGTCNLARDAAYDGNGANSYSSDSGVVAGTSNSGYLWNESGTAATLASSTTVVDDEALILKFAGTTSITTPTGSYGVTSTYIATATF